MSTELETIIPVQFYRLVNGASGLWLVPKFPNDPESVLVQEVSTKYPPEAYYWGFIRLGQELYRVFNAVSGLSVGTKGDPVQNGEFLLQFPWTDLSNQKWTWIFTDNMFHASTDYNLVWGTGKSNAPGAEAQIYIREAGRAFETWIPTPVTASEVGAAAQSSVG